MSFKLPRLLRNPVVRDERAMRDRVERGRKADELMNDETFCDAFQAIERVYIDAWRASDMYQVDLRERAHVAVKLLEDIRTQLRSYMVDGKVALEQIEKQIKNAERASQP
jgi:hypothetical protein